MPFVDTMLSSTDKSTFVIVDKQPAAGGQSSTLLISNPLSVCTPFVPRIPGSGVGKALG